MARYQGADAIYDAAARWKERCLLADGSILSDGTLWTTDNLQELVRLFVDNPDESERKFYTKLKDQLAPSSNGAKRLAAEMFWVLFLFPSLHSMRPATKRLQIRQVWEWGGPDAIPEGAPFDDSVLTGIGATGTAYAAQRWRELRYLIRITGSLKQTTNDRRAHLLGDPWVLAQFLDEQDDSGARQFRHIAAHLLFPDHFERIASGRHKRSILVTFLRNENDVMPDLSDRIGVDNALYELRTKLSAEHGSGFDFYTPGIREKWIPGRDSPAGASEYIDASASDNLFFKKYPGERVWMIAAGEGGRFWSEFKENSFVAVGFEEFDDMRTLRSREEIADRLRRGREDGSNPVHDSLAAWQFLKEMQPGHLVFVKKGRRTILGLGRIASEYRYEADRAGYRHVRNVEWIRTGEWKLPENEMITTKTLTDFTPYRDWLSSMLRRMEGNVEAPPKDDGVGEPVPVYEPGGGAVSSGAVLEPYTLENAMDGLFIPAEQFLMMKSLLGRKKNLILQGPPGTGKTHIAKRLARFFVGYYDPSRFRTIQFHQSYSYEDFVRGWRPSHNGFALRDGLFLELCRAAREDEHRDYVLLIDEINRGDMSRIFGELFSLLERDKRGKEHAVPLSSRNDSEESFWIPENVYVIGTMNTADRSLAVVDYALRRRFGFFELGHAFSSDSFKDHLDANGADEDLILTIVTRMAELNEAIASDRDLGSGYEIGHSYFCVGEDEEVSRLWYETIVRSEIIPLLREYWFDAPKKVAEWEAKLLD